MAIEAPVSNFRKKNVQLYFLICLIVGIWFGYDGYYNKTFIEKHSKDGVIDDTVKFNRKAPYIAGVFALFFAGQFILMKNKKITAADNELIMDNNLKIPYTSIETIDKTDFEGKGYFVVFYKDQSGTEKNVKISSRQFDNVKPILDLLIEKISS
jgi:hypothetical protein